MTASSIDSFDFGLKERYVWQMVESLTLEGHPFLDAIDKDPDYSGEPMPCPFLFSGPQGLGAEFTEAQQNQGNTDGDQWAIRLGDYFGFVSIGDKAMDLSRKNVGAFVKNKTLEIDELYKRFGQDYSIQCWGNGGGAYGRVDTTYTTGNTITLANPLDAVNFAKGMYVQTSAGDGSSTSHTLLASGAKTKVTSVNIAAGTLVLEDAASIGIAASGYLFRAGNFAGANVNKLVKGVEAWIPSSAPSATAFFGVDRTQATTELSGVRPSDSTGNIEERLQRLAEEINTLQGGIGDTGWLHPRQWRKLSISLQNKGVRPLEKSVGRFGYKSLELDCHTGTIDIFGDRHTPVASGFIMDMSSWKLLSTTDIPAVMNGDGFSMLRSPSDASYEYRIKAYGQIVCLRPGHNGRIPLAT